MIMLYKNTTTLIRRLSLTGFTVAGSHFGIPQVTRSQEWSLANNQLNLQDLSLPAHIKLNATNSHVRLKAEWSQTDPQMRLQPQLTNNCSPVCNHTKQKTQLSHARTYRNWEIINAFVLSCQVNVSETSQTEKCKHPTISLIRGT